MKSIKKIFLLAMFLCQCIVVVPAYPFEIGDEQEDFEGIDDKHKNIVFRDEHGTRVLTEEHRKKVLKFMHDSCGDVWCEGLYGVFQFHFFECNIDKKTCFFIFSMHQWNRPEDAVRYGCYFGFDSMSGMFVINSKRDMFFGAEEGFPMTEKLYYTLSRCIDIAVKREAKGNVKHRSIFFLRT